MAYGTPTNVKLGVCKVYFGDFSSGWTLSDGKALGYTQGGVSVSYSTESQEVNVDQEDTPVQEKITKQIFEVTVPLAETSLALLAKLIPGATLVTDAVDATKKKLVLSGSAVSSVSTLAQTLILVPNEDEDGVAEIDNDTIVLHKANPLPNFSFAFEKDNARVYEVVFKALKADDGGFVTFGNPSAAAA